ncbi:unnamed protein product [Moneuplotes crassus]|uniref:Uncharacterized protein n=1 Tax=Euplotes crassus TaxID=5936 RepID=A0AAD1XWJ7_EUPCR|nr:unnamed protein product [Moneuplotes crassus]
MLNNLQQLYKESNRLCYDIDGKINEVYCGFQERSDLDGTVDMIRNKIGIFQDQIDKIKRDYQQLVSSGEITGNNEYHWERKIGRLEKSLKTMPQTLDKAVKNQTRSMEQTQWKDSIERRNRNQEELKKQSENIKASLEYSDNIQNQGNSILESLNAQGEVLKKVKLRTFQFLNVLGVSGSIMRLIDRRGREDNLIVIGLCFLTLIMMYIAYYYIKPMFSFS